MLFGPYWLILLPSMVSLVQLDSLNEKTVHAPSSEMTIERVTEEVVLRKFGVVIINYFNLRINFCLTNIFWGAGRPVANF